MISEEFKSYFDSYARASPLRGRSDVDLIVPNVSGSLMLATENNYGRAYNQLKLEAEYRGVDVPNLFIDESDIVRLGCADSHAYAIVLQRKAYEAFDDQELRAFMAHELKHLYQMPDTTYEESRANEYDCDRAAVESVGYPVIQSYVSKAVFLQAERVLPKPLCGLVQKFNTAFPNLISENFVFRLDPYHPSPAARMKAMREHEATLDRS